MLNEFIGIAHIDRTNTYDKRRTAIKYIGKSGLNIYFDCQSLKLLPCKLDHDENKTIGIIQEYLIKDIFIHKQKYTAVFVYGILTIEGKIYMNQGYNKLSIKFHSYLNNTTKLVDYQKIIEISITKNPFDNNCIIFK